MGIILRLKPPPKLPLKLSLKAPCANRRHAPAAFRSGTGYAAHYLKSGNDVCRITLFFFGALRNKVQSTVRTT
jgi:hypothetical protein